MSGRQRHLKGLAAALSLALCTTAHARQPTINETGPRVWPVEVRQVNHRRWFGLPLIARWHDRGDRLTFDGWDLPGGWEYAYDETGFNSAHVWRRGEKLTLDDLEVVGGLPW